MGALQISSFGSHLSASKLGDLVSPTLICIKLYPPTIPGGLLLHFKQPEQWTVQTGQCTTSPGPKHGVVRAPGAVRDDMTLR